jgi:hypothetical protein
MTRARTIESIELAALVRVRGSWFYVLATPGELVLDYPSYDPSYDPAYTGYRGGLATVAPGDGFAFLAALDDVVFDIADRKAFCEMNGAQRSRPVVAIDFDNATYVSTYFDQAAEMYAGDGWTARFDDPLVLLPPEIRATWA